jgi:hypothetical protein
LVNIASPKAASFGAAAAAVGFFSSVDMMTIAIAEQGLLQGEKIDH